MTKMRQKSLEWIKRHENTIDWSKAIFSNEFIYDRFGSDGIRCVGYKLTWTTTDALEAPLGRKVTQRSEDGFPTVTLSS